MPDISARWLAPGDPSSVSASLTSHFFQVFGREAAGVWFAPGRANLNGEHIDFHGGRCLPMALQHGTYVAAAPRDDGLLRLRTLDAALDTGVIEIPDAASSPAPENTPSWTRYVSGVLWTLGRLAPGHGQLTLEAGYGADVLIRSTLPIGGGLSSSASLECSAALAFVGTGTPLGQQNPGPALTRALTDELRAELAQACIRAEVEVVGAGTGGLDQTTSLRAAQDRLISLDCRDFTLQRTDISFLLRDYQFLAVDTGQPHHLADGTFGARRAESEVAAAVLGVDQLREALPEQPTQADVERTLAEFDRRLVELPPSTDQDMPTCRRRLKHALGEMLRSEEIHRLLTDRTHDVDRTAQAIGDLMTSGHASMRESAEVSFDLADQVVDAALDAGACGARLIGGGFGGSVLVLVPTHRAEEITAAAAPLADTVRFLAVQPSGAARAI